MTIVILNLALDICSLAITLITLYGALIETREKTQRNTIFKYIVATTLACVLIDLSSFYFIFTNPGSIGWYISSYIAAIPPFVWVSFVMFYLIATIREQKKISWNVGWTFAGIDLAAVIIGTILCSRGDAFYWQDNHFVPGLIGVITFVFNVIFVAYYGTICFLYRRTLGWTNSIALFMYIFIPMIGLCIDAYFIGVYSLLFCMTVSVQLCFVMIQHRQILNADHSKTIFLSNMSHDIRTPMNAIMGFTELIEHDLDNREKVAEYIDKIKISGDYLLGLINNVLDMTRIESGVIEINPQCDNVQQLEQWIYPVFNDMVKQKRQTLSVSIEVLHPFVKIDKVKMQQITANLVSNAIKYTPEGGHIEVFLRELPRSEEDRIFYRFIVKDNGIGMSPEFAKHVFDSFSRERNTTESKILGTGLGMAIVKRLVELMDGKISVKSKQGRGTTFTIDLALEVVENPEENVEQQEMPVIKTNSRSKKHHILVAEDNELNAEIITLMLQKEGIVADIAHDGEMCVQMLMKAPERYYEMILMDVQMPRLNGYEAARQIRDLAGTSKSAIPIIAVTANVFEEDRKQATAAGMNSHLSKPIDSSKLKKVLEKYLY